MISIWRRLRFCANICVCPGLGETATRYFRDKLAMRMRATEEAIAVPEFTATFNYEKITRYLESVPAPWLLKPRLMAGAIGIKKFLDQQEVWDKIHCLGDQQSFFVLERFRAGRYFSRRFHLVQRGDGLCGS